MKTINRRELGRLWREYPVTPEQIKKLFSVTGNLLKTETCCIALLEGDSWKEVWEKVNQNPGSKIIKKPAATIHQDHKGTDHQQELRHILS